MEQRREPRFTLQQRVAVTLLGQPEVCRSARIQNVSGRGLGLIMREAVAPGTALQIELENEIVLGEVIYCHPEPDGYFLGIELDQVLSGLAELAARLDEFSNRAEFSSAPLRAPQARRQKLIANSQ